MNREPLLIWSSTLVTLQILAGGAALGDVIGLQTAGLAILVVAALQGGTSFYIRGQVTAASTVIAQTTKEGGVVAGAASAVADGAPVSVDVTQLAPAPGPDDRGGIDVGTAIVIAAAVLGIVLLITSGVIR